MLSNVILFVCLRPEEFEPVEFILLFDQVVFVPRSFITNNHMAHLWTNMKYVFLPDDTVCKYTNSNMKPSNV